MNTNHRFTFNPGQKGFWGSSAIISCPHCGRKLLCENVHGGTSHIVAATVICLECLNLDNLNGIYQPEDITTIAALQKEEQARLEDEWNPPDVQPWEDN